MGVPPAGPGRRWAYGRASRAPQGAFLLRHRSELVFRLKGCRNWFNRRADLSVVDSPHPGTTATEALLSDAFGIPVAIERFEHLAPWAVMRCQFATTADSRVPPRSS